MSQGLAHNGLDGSVELLLACRSRGPFVAKLSSKKVASLVTNFEASQVDELSFECPEPVLVQVERFRKVCPCASFKQRRNHDTYKGLALKTRHVSVTRHTFMTKLCNCIDIPAMSRIDVHP